MNVYSYSNIFDSKGMGYLIIISFLIILVPFWFMINKRTAISGQIKKAIGILSTGILRIPQGLFYTKNHAWTYLEKSGIARVGLDDFLMHITGEVKLRELKKPGNFINKGELLADIDQNGKLLQVSSPISGRIMNTNALLIQKPELINEDPYEKGWIYEIKPSEWMADTDSYYLGNEAVTWSDREFQKFKAFLAESMMKYSLKLQ